MMCDETLCFGDLSLLGKNLLQFLFFLDKTQEIK